MSRLIDFGNGAINDNVVISLSNSLSGDPYSVVFQGNLSQNVLFSSESLTMDNWHHLGVVKIK